MAEVTGFNVDQLGERDVFDIGFGAMVPDQRTMRTGHVPVEAYVSEERFEIERSVFRASWLNVARLEEIPNPGDWLTQDLAIGNTSVLLVRGKDGDVRAFHNMCTHRGTKLVWGRKGHAGQFICPYHAWSFDTHGALRGIPARDCFPGLDRDKSALKPITVDVWEGFVFIHLDPSPRVGLREWLGPLPKMLGDAPFGEYTLACRLSGEMKANWKLFVESQSEGYHVQSLHRLTAKDFVSSRERPFGDYCGLQSLGAHRRATSPRNLDYQPTPGRRVINLAFSSLPHLFLRENDDPSGPFGKCDINKDRVDYWGVELFQVFPNFGINIAYNGFWCTYAWPVTPETCIWEARYYFRPTGSRSERLGIEGSLAFNRDTLLEDVACVERQQEMMRSGGCKTIQFGENEYILRHEAAVWQAVVNSFPQAGAVARMVG
jgi:phenylpropionate dioxygenase-like ring-hydroxylating dioxygenase large terminal subunit